jgi:hypothetical protein
MKIDLVLVCLVPVCGVVVCEVRVGWEGLLLVRIVGCSFRKCLCGYVWSEFVA